ncbi:MAG: hypothetical protein AAB425_01075, partial [Bdellovibrionota bacterium]
MNSRPYLVRLVSGGVSHDSMWPDDRTFKVGSNPKKPLALLDRSGGSVTVRQPGQPARTIPVSATQAGTPVEINGHQMTVVPATTLSPAYRTPDGQTGSRVMAYSGLLRSPTDCEEVVSAFVGKSRGLPVFAVYRTTTGFHLKPLRKSVSFHYGHEAPQTLEAGTTFNIPLDKIQEARITRGHAWWRFGVLSDQGEVPVSELGRLAFDDEPASDAWFNGLLLVATALFVVG